MFFITAEPGNISASGVVTLHYSVQLRIKTWAGQYGLKIKSDCGYNDEVAKDKY